MAEHVWNDAQLAALDRDLGEIDFFAKFKTLVRAGAVNDLISSVEYVKTDHSKLAVVLPEIDLWWGSAPPPDWYSEWTKKIKEATTPLILWLIPNGWLDQYKATIFEFRFLKLLPMVDSRLHRVFPEKEKDALHWLEQQPGTDYWRDIITQGSSSLSTLPKKYGYFQAQIDEARIACRLERYRLAHGNYPESLAKLENAFGPNPPDPVTGEPYQYKQTKNGNYLLYSLGWDQKDDSGSAKNPLLADSIDWIWLNQPMIP